MRISGSSRRSIAPARPVGTGWTSKKEYGDDVGRVRVVVASRSTLQGDLLRLALASEPTLDLVGEALDEQGLARVVRQRRPKILLLDYDAFQPDADGMMGRLRRLAPTTRILALLERSDDPSVERALGAGASGVLGKNVTFEVLLRAVRSVAKGEVWANRVVMGQAFERLSGARHVAPSVDGLSKREGEVVDQLSKGLRNRQIGERLGISEKTVKSHLSNLFRKFRVETRTGLLLAVQERRRPDS